MADDNFVGFYGSPLGNWGLKVDVRNGNLNITGNAFKPGGGPWGSSSDKRLKKNVKPLRVALERMLKLSGVSYE